jgi:hypothetical protein
VTCTPFKTPDGATGIICTATRRCKCGRRATLECDWKMPNKKSGTCDAPLCAGCSTKPAPGKDLCAKHASDYAYWKASR